MKKILIILASLLVVLGAAAFVTVPYAISSAKYGEAETMFAEGDYRGALAGFQAIEDFRDAKDKIQELTKHVIPYAEAETMLAEGKFEKAIAAFEKLGSYNNSPEKILEAKYALADTYFKSADYNKAINAFEELGSYNNSPEKILEVKYVLAGTYFKGGDYSKAISAFEELGDYNNSPVKILEVKYALAGTYFKGGDYSKAISAFEELGSYSDSPVKVLEVKYELADEYFKNADYAAAENIFIELTKQNYRDSSERSDETARHIKYNDAAATLKRNDFTGAYDKFKALGNFLDCENKLIEVDEAYWKQTLAQKTMTGYDTYMKFAGAKHTSEAKAEYERLYGIEQKSKATTAYNAAVNTKTIPALNNFILEWGSSPYIDDLTERANKWIASIRADGTLSAEILNNPNSATQSMIDAFTRDYPGHKDEAKILALNKGELLALVQSGTVTVSVVGDSIDFTTVKLTNKSSRDVTVTIPVGLYFAASSGTVQNMTVRASKTVTIRANGSTSVNVATACMNINRNIPNSNDAFSVYSLDKNSKLARVMALLEEKGASYAVTQAAVWIVTDNPNEYDLLNTLVYVGGGRAINENDLAQAREIVRLAG
ncbi:MAG: outer membrane protein assembly factor BamD [Oscillospiraceae bacterium]|nr:outer membrane protein assembly factor BamD [Oscillospiraceae bacterium]